MSNHPYSQLSPFFSNKYEQSPFLAKQHSIPNMQYNYENMLRVDGQWSEIKSDLQMSYNQQSRCSPRKTPLNQQLIKSPNKYPMTLRQTPRRNQELGYEMEIDQGPFSRDNSLKAIQQDPFRSRKLLNFIDSSRPSYNENQNPNIPAFSIPQNILVKEQSSPLMYETLLSPMQQQKQSVRKTPISSQNNQNMESIGFNRNPSHQYYYLQHQQSPKIKPFPVTGIPQHAQVHQDDGRQITRKQESTATNSEIVSEEDQSLISPIHYQKTRSIRLSLIQNNPNYQSEMSHSYQFERYVQQANIHKQDQINQHEDFTHSNIRQEQDMPNAAGYQNFQYNSPAPKQSYNYYYVDTPEYIQSHATASTYQYSQQRNHQSNNLNQGSGLLRLSKCKTTITKKRAKRTAEDKSSPQSLIKQCQPQSENQKKRIIKSEQKGISLMDKIIAQNQSPIAKQKHAKATRANNQNNQVQSASQISPKEIKPKSQNVAPAHSFLVVPTSGATQSTKKCTCSKSKCLKLYCECFANGQVCGLDCGCKDCCNNDDSPDIIQKAKEEIMKRDPKAFEIKVTKDNQGKSIQHRKGCTCKKSGCLKGYCECFQMGVSCTDFCKCSGCANCEKKEDSNKSPRKQVNNGDFMPDIQREVTEKQNTHADHSNCSSHKNEQQRINEPPTTRSSASKRMKTLNK